MARLLEESADQFEAQAYPYSPSVRLQKMEAQGRPTDVRAQITYDATHAEILMHSGRARESAELFEAVLAQATENPAFAAPGVIDWMQFHLGAAWMHVALQNNCVQPGGSASCLVPILADGAFADQAGLREAIDAFAATLRAEPDNLSARWLLNLSHMNLGTYPDSVPAEWLIPPQVFQSDHDITRFPDVAHDVGLDVLAHAGGSIWADFDRDGYLDVVVSSWGVHDQLRYFHNNVDGSFTERTVEAGLQGIVGGLNINQTDYNNDGHIDVLVLRGGWIPDGHPNSLLRNNGDGTFEDVTEAAGLLWPLYPTQTACWADFDNDGWLDLFIGNESLRTRHPSQLFHNNRNGTFTDVSQSAGVTVVGYIKGVACGDVDNDGDPDMFLSSRGKENILLRNDGLGDDGTVRFTDVSSQAKVDEPYDSFPTWMFDYDNDGWLDIFVSGFRSRFGDVAAEYLGLPHDSELPRLYRNNGDLSFTDVTVPARVNKIMFTMGCNFGDLDNDGWLDFYVATGDMGFQALVPSRMFRNAGGQFFQEVTASGGFGHLAKGHGVAFADWDNDGDQDIFAQLGGAYEGDRAYSALFQNPGHGNNWITLRLEGVVTNRAAIGAHIQVTVTTAEGSRDIFRTVSSGGSFGASSLQQEIGLGQATKIDRVTITWPTSGATTFYRNLETGRAYHIREGDPAPTPLELDRLSVPGRRDR
jgi:hypothetical protein